MTPTTSQPVWRGVIERYRELLPIGPGTPVVTLLEGGTPLVAAPVLSARVSCDVFLKVEGANPTGSFKDRGMTVAVSKALEEGSRAVLCASTGNTSASAAAYAARAAITCAVLVPEGKIALVKLAQALVHGARVLAVEGSFDDCLVLARDLAEHYPVTLVNSVNPFRIQGQKTVAFEIVEALARAPDVHCIPVGNAGNITATWLGYSEAAERGLAQTRPRMLGFQAAGAAPLVHGRPVPSPSTIATAIRIGRPASAPQALRAVRGRAAGHRGRRRAPAGLTGGLHADGQRAQGPRLGGVRRPSAHPGGGGGGRRRRRARPRRRGGRMSQPRGRAGPEAAGTGAGAEAAGAGTGAEAAPASVRVLAPATSANLGPGFDAAGLALDWWDSLEVRSAPVTSVRIAGEQAEAIAVGEDNLVLRAMRHLAAASDTELPPLRLDLVKGFPLARGFGSSAAAVTLGLLAARALLAPDLPDAMLLGLATELEGHPDNVAPCLSGGATLCWSEGAGAQPPH